MRNRSCKKIIKYIVYSMLTIFCMFLTEGKGLSEELSSIVIDKWFSDSQVIYPFSNNQKIFGIAIEGSIKLNNYNSLIRIILLDNNSHEYLVYEAYPLIVDSNSDKIINRCEETCILEGLSPYLLKIELIDASLYIDQIIVNDNSSIIEKGTQTKIKTKRDKEKIEKINENIKKKGLKWTAGETSVSRLFYEEKRKLFGGDKVPNLQGAEFYRGGVFEIKSEAGSSSISGDGGSSLIESYDWRNRHGADDPASPYYDSDPTGSGWITPVKYQGCAHCWAFTPLHATEAIVNLYFNQHLDLDLSEQDVVSCSGGNIGCCEGGFSSTALDYIVHTGVVDESCFPYSASCAFCSNKCNNPNEQITISGRTSLIKTEEEIKRAIIDYGPISGGISSWWHYMVIVGFDKDQDTGETIWIFKNSYGTAWGDNGYGYIKVPLGDLYGLMRLETPVTSLLNTYEIACNDYDGDGYYNWGIAAAKPPSCPANVPPYKDCDDFNSSLGPFDADGNCIETCTIDSNFEITTITAGMTYYTDRNYFIKSGVPSWMEGRTLIKTPNNERFNHADSGYIRFTTPVSWWVYVLFDSRASDKPDWLNGWEFRSQYKIYTSLSTQPHLQVWRKFYEAGECVDLGGNFGPGSSDENRSNYVVVYGKDGYTNCTLDPKFGETDVEVGAYYYTDRTYTITGGVPSWMVGRTLIQTPNDEKKNSLGSGYVRFQTPVSWWVYVLFDSRSADLPDWLNGWELRSQYQIQTSLATQPYLKVYRKWFDSGKCVDLGGNYGPGSSGEYRSNYAVVYGK